MITITPNISVNASELEFSYIRSPGPGGQNVNKVATGVQLRFNVHLSSSFSDEIRQRIMQALHNKLTTQGELIIKATRYRTQEKNKQDALERLIAFLQQAVFVHKKRRKTKPTYSSQLKRLAKKKLHSTKKALRRRED